MQAPFDGRFKILAEDHPELLLRLLGILRPGTKSTIVDVLRELQLDSVQVDHAYRIVEGGRERLVHLEAISHWDYRRTSRLALYRFLLRQKFEIPLTSYLILMSERYAPRKLPPRVFYREPDGFLIKAPYQVIRLWEIDPELAFEPGCEALLPWAAILKGDVTQLDRVSLEIAGLKDHPERAPYPVEAMLNNLVVLAGLKYDKDVIRQLEEKLRKKMTLSTDLFTDTWLYKEGVAAGEKAGIEKGVEQGMRAAVNNAIKARFPALSPLPELDRISSCEILDRLHSTVCAAQTQEDVRLALQNALRAIV